MSSDTDIEPIDTNFSREQSASLLQIQHEIMEQLALGTDHQSILDALCRAAEHITENAVASVMLFDESNTFLQVIAAPSLSADAIAQLNGLVPGEEGGSCGAAVYSNKPQYVCNTQADKRWSVFHDFIESFKIGACWSNPIRMNETTPIGSFALASFETRQPTEFHKRLLETCAYIAGIVIKRQKEEDQLWKMAHYDGLTNLPNRSFFNSHLDYSIRIAQRTGKQFALLFLDLDRFKDINDTQGHEAGDEVLKYIAESIKSSLRKNDMFARIGGDEFVILIEDLDDSSLVQQVCEKIASSFLSKVTIQGIDYPLTTSIGVSVFPEHGETPQMLLRNADTAMYAAKRRGAGNYCFYEAELTHNVTERIQLTAEIRKALVQHQFEVYFQPQFDSVSEQLTGAEALIRWPHPDKGMIPPVLFIPVAEQSELIKEIGLYVLEKACRQCLAWWDAGLPKFILAVNVSVNQLDVGFSDHIHNVLKSMAFPIDKLELEITESQVINFDDLEELKKLESLGVGIAMDDFGTGHSSLAHLKRLPITKLKIDRSFVKDLQEDSDDKVIASAIISMGQSLGLKVVAEGVETDAQKCFLVDNGCDQLQGYLLGRPMPPEEFEGFVSSLN